MISYARQILIVVKRLMLTMPRSWSYDSQFHSIQLILWLLSFCVQLSLMRTLERLYFSTTTVAPMLKWLTMVALLIGLSTVMAVFSACAVHLCFWLPHYLNKICFTHLPFLRSRKHCLLSLNEFYNLMESITWLVFYLYFQVLVQYLQWQHLHSLSINTDEIFIQCCWWLQQWCGFNTPTTEVQWNVWGEAWQVCGQVGWLTGNWSDHPSTHWSGIPFHHDQCEVSTVQEHFFRTLYSSSV